MCSTEGYPDQSKFSTLLVKTKPTFHANPKPHQSKVYTSIKIQEDLETNDPYNNTNATPKSKIYPAT